MDELLQFEDDIQMRLERLYLFGTKPRRIANALKLPIGEVRQRIAKFEKDLKHGAGFSGPDRAMVWLAQRIARAEQRYSLLATMHDEGEDRLGCLKQMREEDKFCTELVTKGMGLEIQAPVAAGNAEVADLLDGCTFHDEDFDLDALAKATFGGPA